MTDDRYASSEPQGRPSTLADAVEDATRRITTGLVIAGAIVGLAVYARPAPPRFDAFAMGDKIIRVDQKTGTIIACEGQQTCQLILRKGQRLVRVRRTDAPARPALPRPATPPAAAPAAGK